MENLKLITLGSERDSMLWVRSGLGPPVFQSRHGLLYHPSSSFSCFFSFKDTDIDEKELISNDYS